MRDRIVELIGESYRRALSDAGHPPAPIVDEETRLFGAGARLDSMGLVSLVLGVEERLADDLGLEMTLMDDRALSQERSPFRTVGSLADYVVSRLDDGTPRS